jgi:hypothetical protein
LKLNNNNNNNNNNDNEKKEKENFLRQQHTDQDKILSFIHKEIHMESNARISAMKIEKEIEKKIITH